ncbi:MAG: response regulator transcription factor [Myxococcales bacterium FL481]|nr:MAG: response regulator transcription factor [Myxococcales bacterium FL481]
MSPVILIVEDEPDLVATLTYNLRQAGFVTRSATSGQEALTQARAEPLPDLVLLDLMLPDISGTTVCRELRGDATTRHIPVVMLTAKGDEVDRVVGFELGAEDYVVKPFSVRELILRIQAILRRSQAPQNEPTGILRFGRLRVDPDGHRVWVDGEPTQLTALEFRLLLTLLNRRGRVQTRDVLLEDVWGMVADVTTRTVDTHVKRLRQKLGEAGSYIETLRGVGYRWRDSPDDEQPVAEPEPPRTVEA